MRRVQGRRREQKQTRRGRVGEKEARLNTSGSTCLCAISHGNRFVDWYREENLIWRKCCGVSGKQLEEEE